MNRAGKLFVREGGIFLLMLSVAFAVYGKALANDFLLNWDDPSYVVYNLAAHGFSLAHLRSAFSDFFAGNYAPLHIISYMLDYTLWRLNPAGYIAHNVVLHALNGYLLYLLARRISAAVYPSLLAALLFIMHPAQVESVVWISQRKNVLAMLFFMLALHQYISYRDGSSACRKRHYLLCFGLFTCALLTKSVAVVLPLVLVIYDLSIEKRELRSSLVDKLPHFAIALIFSIVTMFSQLEVNGGGRAAFHGGGAIGTFLTMLPVFAEYLRIIVLPTHLSAVYSPEIKSSPDIAVAGALVLLLFLGLGIWLLCRRNRQLLFWVALGGICILPVSQIVPLVTLMNERYLYFPLVGIAPFIVFGAKELIRAGSYYARYVAAFFLVILTILGSMSAKRSLAWKNSQTLWKDAVATNPENDVALYNLANSHLEDNQLESARPLLEKLVTIQANNGKCHELIGHYFYRTGEVDKAEAAYKKALELSPRLPQAAFCLGNIYLSRHELRAARDFLATAERFGPIMPDLLYSRACLESLAGDSAKAVSFLEEAFKAGFQRCEAVRINEELDPVRTSPNFKRLMTTFCKETFR